MGLGVRRRKVCSLQRMTEPVTEMGKAEDGEGSEGKARSSVLDMLGLRCLLHI
jgi:hypothetical protein